MKATRTRRLAERLLWLARRMLPAARRAWACDMRAELDHVAADDAALRWALGCVLAGAMERMNMLNANGSISRWVLSLEWLMCFTPLTLIWIAAVHASVGREHVPMEVIVATAFGTLGPVALIVSLAATLRRSLGRSSLIAAWLVAAFASSATLQLVNAAASGRLRLQWFQIDLSVFVLLSVLPLLGSLHLLHLARQRSSASSAT